MVCLDLADEKDISAFDLDETGTLALEFSKKWRNAYIEELRSTKESLIVPPLVLFRNSVFLVVFFGGLRIKYLKMKQMSLEENRMKLTEVVTEKTAKLKIMLNRYTALYEYVNDAICLLKDGVFIECNKKTLDFFDLDALVDFIRKMPADISPEHQEDALNSEAYQSILNTQRRVDEMAKMHEHLYSYNSLVEISSADYCREIGQFFHSKDGNDYSGIGIQLVSGLALPLNGKPAVPRYLFIAEKGFSGYLV